MADAYISPEGRGHPSTYEPETLFRLLVEDAVRAHATEITWMMIALQRIGDARRNKRRQTAGQAVDAVMKALLDEVEQLTGLRRLPLHSGPIAGVRG